MHINHLPLLYLLAGIMICTSCKEKSQVQKDTGKPEWLALEKEVMDIHDEVMPKLQDIHKISRKLSQARTEMELGPDMEHQVRTSLRNLNAADSLMWDWMHNYKRPNPEQEIGEIQAYLLGEKEKVIIVRDAMLGSISEGQKVLSSLNEKNE